MKTILTTFVASLVSILLIAQPAMAACEAECGSDKIRLELLRATGATTDEIAAKEGELAQKCDVIDKASTAQTWQLTTAILYTVAAGVCAVSCFWKVAYALCSGTGLLASATDLIATTVIIASGNSSLNNFGEGATQFGGTGAGAVGGGFAAASLFAKVGHVKSKDSCVAAGLFTAAAAFKWAGIAVSGSVADSACTDVKRLTSLPGGASDGTAPVPGSSPGPTALAGGGGGAFVGAGGSGASTTGSPGLGALDKLDLDGDSESSLFSTAYAQDSSAVGDILRKVGPKDALKSKANEMFGSMKDIGKRLANGEGPGSIVSSAIGNLPAGAADALKSVDKAALEGRLQMGGVSSAAPSASGGGKSGGSGGGAPAFPMFGAKTPTGGSGSMSFDKVAKGALAEPGSEDIFHEGWNGTIFQLVTFRLDKTKDRIDKMEWQTPLNRALSGLPALKGSTNSRGGR